MQELTEDRCDDRPMARDGAVTTAALPPFDDKPEDQPGDALDEEAVIRERLRQIRLESAHIPIAHEPPPSLLSRVIGLFRR